jgi:hypothetical protein
VRIEGGKVFFNADGKAKWGKWESKPATKPAPVKTESKVKAVTSELTRPPGIAPKKWAGMSTKEQEDYLSNQTNNRRNLRRGTSVKVIERNTI